MTEPHADCPPPEDAPDAATPRRTRLAYVEWAADIPAERQIWLWDNRIPVGTVSALAGRGGTGKTTYALHLAAQLSQGTLPGEHHGDPRPVLIWSGEDAWGSVLIPRLIAAGADMSRVGRLAITSTDIDAEVTPALPLDVGAIRDAVVHTGAVMVLIDPIASTMRGDLHREADVRAAIDCLARMAADTGTVVMFVRHFGKGGGVASEKMSGSHAFRDAVRSVFLFAEDGDTVVVSQDKGNYSARGESSFAFRLESVTVPTDTGPAEVARIVELGASDVSVSDIINRSEASGDDDADERTAAEHWLQDYLTANGETPSKTVKADAAKEKIAERTLKRAKKNLGIIDRSSGFPRTSTWQLPSRAIPPETVCHSPEPGPTGPTEPERRKQDGPTEQDSQSGHAPESGPTDGPAALTLTPTAPTPLSVRQQRLTNKRTVRFKGQEVPRCRYCGAPVLVGQGDHHLSCASKHGATA